MKIAIIHYRLILRGGLERRLINYTNYLTEAGHEVHIIVAKNSGEITFSENVKIHVLRLGLMPKIFRQRYFDYRLGKFMRKHVFDFSLSLMRTSHQDIVLCPGNHLGFLKAENRKPARLKDWEQIASDRKAFESSKHILAASGMMADEVSELYRIERSKIQILFPPVDENIFNFSIKQKQIFFRNKYKLPLNKRLFLFVSSSHKRKGLDLILKCFEHVVDTDAVLVIAGLPEVKTHLPNVLDMGFVPAVEELYAATDFTIHPASYEPFGQIVSESLCCGTPVIISDMVGAKEILEANEGLIIPLQYPEWLHAIRESQVAQFTIQPDVARRKKLQIDQHMQRILKVANTM